MEFIPSLELVPNVNQITHRIELELELMPKNHQNPSPDSDPALELIQPYSGHFVCLAASLINVNEENKSCRHSAF